MAIQTLPSTPLPDHNPEIVEEPKYLSARFDGYEQRVAKGINNVESSVTLSWTNIKSSEATTLRDFFKAHYNGVAFYWTPDGEPSPLKWIVVKVQRKIVKSGKFHSLSADLKRVYDL